MIKPNLRERLLNLFFRTSRALADAQAVVLLGIVFVLMIIPTSIIRRAFRASRGKAPQSSYFVQRAKNVNLGDEMERPF